MNQSRRAHLCGLASIAVAGATAPPAWAQSPLVGVWSAIFKKDGWGDRIRLEITADGKAILTFVDLGNTSLPASTVDLKPNAVHLEWRNFGITARGVLKDPNALVVHVSGPAVDEPETRTMVRGDLFPVNTTVLPHGLMSLERLHQLRLISEAPALGVAYAFKYQPTTHVLVDGLRSADGAVPVAADDKWHIGSCTKSMTATLAARLVEAGRITWQTTVGEVLGPRLKGMNSSYRDANLLHLLSHHAGLQRDAPGSAKFGFGPRKDIHAERLQYAARLLAMAPLGPLGTTESYSNGGVVVAATMLEVVTDRRWEELMREQVFAPLKLASAGFGPPAVVEKLDSPLGHGRGLDGKLHAVTEAKLADVPRPVAAPCGAVHINLADLVEYLKAHRDLPPGFLSEASWKTLHTPPFGGGSALGWGLAGDGGFAHSGSNGMWYVNVYVNPWGMVFAAAQNATTPNAISVMNQAQDAAARSWD